MRLVERGLGGGDPRLGGLDIVLVGAVFDSVPTRIWRSGVWPWPGSSFGVDLVDSRGDGRPSNVVQVVSGAVAFLAGVRQLRLSAAA